MIKSGTLIGGRYEVLEKIGTGGMSDVYKARDQKLNRFVAVKILKQEFSENTGFVSKFRVEAQAAAGLMHPNIVNVYDVGEEDGIHYIVMELVEGITLKKYIEKKVRLTTKEAISIAIQVAMGIEAAHNNHIIHRDIKPQNIIISKEGKVKVTDFGIAKAATSNTITSNVMGSVHYTSPEQARGGFSDEKSDIYSLGITIFEMLTGRVPFNGDTTVSIAIKHIQDDMPSMREIVPEVPVSVENIVMKCTQKSPDRRYQCMGDMIKDLKHSLINPDDVIAQPDVADEAGKTKVVVTGAMAAGMAGAAMAGAATAGTVTAEAAESESMAGEQSWEQPRMEQPRMEQPLRPRREEYAEEADLEQIPTRQPRQAKPTYTDDEYISKRNVKSSNAKSGGARKSSTSNQAQKKKAANAKGSAKKRKSRRANDDYEDYPQEIITRQNVRRDSADRRSYSKGKKDEYDYNPKAEGFATLLTVIGAVIIGCILIYFVGRATGIFEQMDSLTESGTSSSDESERAVMPEFEGVDVDEVKEALNSVGLGYKTTYEESTQYAKNLVMSAALEDGTQVLANDKILLNTTIVLTVSAGTDGIEIPDVLGKSEAEGTAELTNAGFNVVKEEEYSSTFAKGMIMSQSPEGGGLAPLESDITIVISKGESENEVTMPSVLGYSQEGAVSTLEAAGLVVGEITEAYSSEYSEGKICYQGFEAGVTVSEGTEVDLKISLGSEILTYSCSVVVQAPDDFYAGGSAEIILTTADGSTQLWYSQNVTSFPVSINLSGFESTSSYGIVTITYIRQVEQTVTDADGNVSTQMGTEVAQTQQNVQFALDN